MTYVKSVINIAVYNITYYAILVVLANTITVNAFKLHLRYGVNVLRPRPTNIMFYALKTIDFMAVLSKKTTFFIMIDQKKLPVRLYRLIVF